MRCIDSTLPRLLGLFGLLVIGGGPWRPLAAQARGVSIADVNHAEAGSSGSGLMQFIVAVVRDTTVASGQVSVQFQGVSGTATVGAQQCAPGIDIVVQPSTVTIPANANSATINAVVCEDALDEADAETFTVTLFGASGSSITDGTATGTLLDDDATPSLRVNDLSAAEGAVGEQRTLSFVITLGVASGRQVSVNYAVANGSPAPASGGASCGGTVDFVSRTGTETFAPGTLTRTVAVTLCGDGIFEGDERIALTLSAPVNATIADGSAVGTVTNDDAQPMVSVAIPGQGMTTEGTGGTSVFTITVSLSNANHAGAGVRLAFGGSAQRGAQCTGSVDVRTTATDVQFDWPAGTNTPQTLDVTICGDARDEDNDTFSLTPVALTAAAMVPGTQSLLVIFDNDPPPSIDVSDVQVTEGNGAAVNVTLSAVSEFDVDVVLSADAGVPPNVSVLAATAGSACSGQVDFVRTSHRVSVPAGSLAATTPLTVKTCGGADVVNGAVRTTGVTEAFAVTASLPARATLGRKVGYVAIKDP